MYSIRSNYYELGNSVLVASTSIKGVEEAKKASASRSHSEAERRRRKRINGHLSSLRTLLPNTIKTDKASLLTEVVRHLRELKSTTFQLLSSDNNNNNNDNDTIDVSPFSTLLIPTETNQLHLCRMHKESSSLIRATMSCDDRPQLISDVAVAVRAADGRVVRAEMATVGGRTKAVLWVHVSRDGNEERLRWALKGVVDRARLSTGLSQGLPDCKRPRHSQ